MDNQAKNLDIFLTKTFLFFYNMTYLTFSIRKDSKAFFKPDQGANQAKNKQAT
ncbi:MAG TPA: hypothetical protein VLG50_00710 [Candidatus Saccharimonadales bacterium]|nr:hypothetical protein [Candidatus Saccharimonadales bacterium]